MTFRIATPRLDLILEDIAALEAFSESPAKLASLLGAQVPPQWPVCGADVIAYVIDWLKSDPELGGFGAYFIIHRADRMLIGDGGFKGRPNQSGEVELGYSLIEAYRGQGYATEAARALADWAFRQPDVTAVRAETLPDGFASQAVLKKIGMVLDGEYRHPDDGRVFRWRLDRRNRPPPR
ncbi:GNAT family N-acetyltransferase [Dehalogenimonas alkenigignens]|uniref:GNAT family N-acetyltransferase n=1 Tax=Dehalogenimonas alkenigignens TaxID=1217799 RepID=UPI000D56E53E|nr:GNAT family N-acetyltransferase [Dehalogenimonas alkenigignens]PVV83667.1 GNAT family N-acetyltransferase [Dehalogenimonas alkenigignens]